MDQDEMKEEMNQTEESREIEAIRQQLDALKHERVELLLNTEKLSKLFEAGLIDDNGEPVFEKH